MIVLSVHLITYNNEKHIEETLQSILKQKLNFKYEIVVGDDCSTDKTFEIISKYSNEYPDIFHITKNKSQLGILKNYKATLDRCKGEFVFDIAGDDILKTDNAFQKMVSVLQKDSSLGFVDSGYDRLDDKDNSITPFKNSEIINVPIEAYKKALLLGKIAPIGHCFNKKLMYKYVDFNTYLNMNLTIEDYPILIDLVMQTNFERINESLHVYRVHDKSHSHQKDFEELLFQKNQMKNLFDYFTNKYNFSKELIDEYTLYFNKELLALSGYFQNKSLGKKMYSLIKSKTIIDYIHFYSSQYPWFRKLVSFRKKLFIS